MASIDVDSYSPCDTFTDTPVSVQLSSTADQTLNNDSDQLSKKKISQDRPKIECSPRINYSDFTVHVLTWNIASTTPSPADIESLFLPQESLMLEGLFNNTDIIVVGLQEAYQSVQDAMTTNLPLIGRDPLVDLFSDFLALKGFARLSSSRLLGILTMVFIKRPLLCYIRNLETSTYKTGLNGIFGNKGASSIRFSLGDLSVCFTNCHLIPHPENNDRRATELRDILEKQVFSYSQPSKLLEHDLVILFGDLNFRLDGHEFHEVVTTLTHHGYQGLVQYDQLILEQQKGNKSASNLYSFMEMPFDFQPSYKYEPGTDRYDDGGKGRAPAWTDRILWRPHDRRLPQITDSEPRAVIHSKYYGMHTQPRISDHKAVSGGLVLSVDISCIVPLVIFRLNEWVVGCEAEVSFDVMARTQVSIFDWIGLYPCDFSSVERDYIYYTYSPAKGGEGEDKVYHKTLTAGQVPATPGRYVLVYKSNQYNCVLGMSPVFRITERENS